MKKLSFLVVAALLSIGCAHTPVTKSQIQEAKSMLRSMAPEVVAYYNKNHKCPPFNTDEYEKDPWAKKLQTTKSAHWDYNIWDPVLGLGWGYEDSSSTCSITATFNKAYKPNSKTYNLNKKVPFLILGMNDKTPSKVFQLKIERLTGDNKPNKEPDEIDVIVVSYHEADEKTCYKFGGHMDKDLGCIIF